VGLVILLIIVAYVAIAVVVVRAIKSRKWKVAAAVAAILIPMADAVIGRLHLHYLCETQAGVRVFKVVQEVDGFFDARLRPHPEWIVKHGYQFVEGKNYDGKPMRISLTTQNTLLEERNVIPRSRYRFEYSSDRSSLGFGRVEWTIRDIQSAEVLARYVTFAYVGGWAERLLGAFTDSGGSFAGACFEGAERPSKTQFLKQTLVPKQPQ